MHIGRGGQGAGRSRRLVAALLLVVGVAACGGDDDADRTAASSDRVAPPEGDAAWQETVQAAEEEGEVVLYSPLPPGTIDRLVDGFQEAYPDIEIVANRGTNSAELVARLDQERDGRADGGDVVLATQPAWFVERDAAGELLAPEGPSATGWSDEFLLGTAVIGGFEPFGLVYNTSLVDEPITGYDDLLGSDLEGRLGTAEPSATPIVAFYDWLAQSHGDEYLEQLAAQDPRLYVGSTPLSQAVASGEIAATAFAIPSSMRELADQGAPVEFVLEDGAIATQYLVGAVGWSHRPNAARVLLDYLMSPDGQTAWHGTGDSSSPRDDIDGDIDLDTLTPYDQEAYSQQKIDEVTARWEELFR